MMSLPATKGFEIGSGFNGTFLKGSEHNDLFEEQWMVKSEQNPIAQVVYRGN